MSLVKEKADSSCPKREIFHPFPFRRKKNTATPEAAVSLNYDRMHSGKAALNSPARCTRCPLLKEWAYLLFLSKVPLNSML